MRLTGCEALFAGKRTHSHQQPVNIGHIMASNFIRCIDLIDFRLQGHVSLFEAMLAIMEGDQQAHLLAQPRAVSAEGLFDICICSSPLISGSVRLP